MTEFDLADLLTAAGMAMGTSNTRLAATGAPALLREFALTLSFNAAFATTPGNASVLFEQVSVPSPRMPTTGTSPSPNVTINATYIAAPALQTVPPQGGGADP